MDAMIASVVTDASSTRLLSGGEEAFPRMLSAIEQARGAVHLEVYSLHRDRIGLQFIRHWRLPPGAGSPSR